MGPYKKYRGQIFAPLSKALPVLYICTVEKSPHTLTPYLFSLPSLTPPSPHPSNLLSLQPCNSSAVLYSPQALYGSLPPSWASILY